MIDCIIKLGGSLLYSIPKIDCLISKLAKDNVKAILTVGSGYLGEVFKEFINTNSIELGFETAINCWSNIQSINANIITGINQSVSLCSNINDITNILDSGKLPIIDTISFHSELSNLLLQTSDIRSACLGYKFNCNKLIIMTDVGGIFDKDPKKFSDAKKIKEITATKLSQMGRTSVDKGLAEKIIEYKIITYVIGADEYINSELTFKNFIQTQSTIIYP